MECHTKNCLTEHDFFLGQVLDMIILSVVPRLLSTTFCICLDVYAREIAWCGYLSFIGHGSWASLLLTLCGVSHVQSVALSFWYEEYPPLEVRSCHLLSGYKSQKKFRPYPWDWGPWDYIGYIQESIVWDRAPSDPTATVVLSLRSQQALALSRQVGGVIQGDCWVWVVLFSFIFGKSFMNSIFFIVRVDGWGFITWLVDSWIWNLRNWCVSKSERYACATPGR